jgi:hypothetical protein
MALRVRLRRGRAIVPLPHYFSISPAERGSWADKFGKGIENPFPVLSGVIYREASLPVSQRVYSGSQVAVFNIQCHWLLHQRHDRGANNSAALCGPTGKNT